MSSGPPTPIISPGWPWCMESKSHDMIHFHIPNIPSPCQDIPFFSFHSCNPPWSQTTFSLYRKATYKEGVPCIEKRPGQQLRRTFRQRLKQRGIQRPPLLRDRWIYDHRSGFDIETRRTLLCLSACSTLPQSVYVCTHHFT